MKDLVNNPPSHTIRTTAKLTSPLTVPISIGWSPKRMQHAHRKQNKKEDIRIKYDS